MSDTAIFLCAPVRTAIGTYDGTLKSISALELGAVVIGETLKRAKLDPANVESVVMGQVIQAGAKMNPARQAAVKGHIPVTVDRGGVSGTRRPILAQFRHATRRADGLYRGG